MTRIMTERRKEQLKKNSKKWRAKKKASGYIWYTRSILPEWEEALNELLERLRRKKDNERD